MKTIPAVSPLITQWAKSAAPDPERDRLERSYVAAKAEHGRMQRRPSVLTAELTAVSRAIVAGTGDLTELMRTQAALLAEREILHELREEAATTYMNAAQRFGSYIERQASEEFAAHDRIIAEGRREQEPLRRVMNTLPQPESYDEARERFAAIGERLQPHLTRLDVCRQAAQAARSLKFDDQARRQLLADARKAA